MFLNSINLLTWRKSLAQRAAAYVIAVFMLQMIAAGFCVPMASAAATQMEKQQTSKATHCMQSPMSQEMSHEQSQASVNDTVEHVCTHCDLPDLSLLLDKQVQVLDSATPLILFIGLLPSLQTITIADFQNLSPPLRTSLFTFDLNQRFRV